MVATAAKTDVVATDIEEVLMEKDVVVVISADLMPLGRGAKLYTEPHQDPNKVWIYDKTGQAHLFLEVRSEQDAD